jgi:hypothetical protein
MSTLLQSLDLAPPPKGKPRLSGLVSVKGKSFPPTSIAEGVALHEARLLAGAKETQNISFDYIFFRRFSDGRSSQVAAYVLDNSGATCTNAQIAELHQRVWLSGAAPLLYVEWPTRVDVLRCAAEPDFWDKKKEGLRYEAAETIQTVSDVSHALDETKISRFSACRLSDGTFWEAPENADWACADKAAHRSLIQAVVEADKDLQGAQRPLMRRLLLLFIFAKYLEDRGVFPKKPESWFAQFHDGASSFQEVLASGNTRSVKRMLTALTEKFNGDIFDISTVSATGIDTLFTRDVLLEFARLLEARTLKRQMYLWRLYSFNFIPVEVLSHLYQHFAQKGNGAVFTPPLVVDLMLDHAMPYEKITGQETVFDPTCGSGIFLVGAFRRLVHHWQSQNGWARPGVPQLKRMLKTSIFGAELERDAAQVAAFNLALAICDALQPKIIWEHLRFDTLIGENIFVGDVFENLAQIQDVAGDGFTNIFGNPPFKSELTPAAKKWLKETSDIDSIPDKQIAYFILNESMGLLSSNGHMCLIQTAGVLYNAEPRKFFADFLSKHTVETILDFVSIRNLFESADAKAVAILASPPSPPPSHEIIHLTFRRTKSVHDRIGFELDHYDWHHVSQMTAVEFPSVWKANLLGGGRLVHLSQKVSALPTLEEYWDAQGWSHGEGFIDGKPLAEGKPDKRMAADWLTDKPFLPTSAISEHGINKGLIGVVSAKKFRFRAKEQRFTPPMFLIVQTKESLPTALWNEGYLTFLQDVVSINAPPTDAKGMQQFARAFDENKATIKALSLLKSPQALVGRSSAIIKEDLEKLPWPKDDGSMTFAFWEQILLDDILEHTAQLLRIGQNAPVLTKQADDPAFEKYASLFVKMLGSVYRNFTSGRSGCFGGLAYQSFYFGAQSNIDWPDDWSEKLAKVVHKTNSIMHTSRVLRFYEGNTLIIVKPDRLRYWIPSTAIWDADETLGDMVGFGF